MPHRWSTCVLAGVLLASGAAVGVSAPAADARTVVLRGTLRANLVLRRTKVNVLDGRVVIPEGITLRIKAGAVVLASAGAILVVERGGRILAEGTAERPIVFTSAQPEAERRRGDWGGIVVNGRAPVGVPGGTVEPGDASGAYGGGDPGDGSGVLRFVRIEYAGFPTDGPANQPALSLRGAGDGTVVERVEALNGDGTGIAVAGGTVAASYLAAVGCTGHGIAAESGWSGSVQFALSVVRGDLPAHAGAGVSIENCPGRMANVTVAGGRDGIRIQGTTGGLSNAVVTRCTGDAVSRFDAATAEAVAQRRCILDGLLLGGNRADNMADTTRATLAEAGAGVLEADPRLTAAGDEAAPDCRPAADSPAVSNTLVAPTPDDRPMVPTSYVGAFGPGDGANWASGWVDYEIPPVPRYLANASATPEELSRAFLAELEAGDIPSLKRHRITKDEFCWHVWPGLPSSQIPNLTCDFAWSQATLSSLSGLDSLLARYSGRRFEYVGIRFAGGATDRASFRVLNDSRLTIRDESGVEREMKLFGSMLEMDGRYKLFSHVID